MHISPCEFHINLGFQWTSGPLNKIRMEIFSTISEIFSFSPFDLNTFSLYEALVDSLVLLNQGLGLVSLIVDIYYNGICISCLLFSCNFIYGCSHACIDKKTWFCNPFC